jgi:hypothetical protein
VAAVAAPSIEALYRERVPIEEMASLLGVTKWKVRKELRERHLMRGRGKPGIPEDEVVRRKAIGAQVTSWADYQALAGVRNPRLDRRLGVRLRCFLCPKLSTTYGSFGRGAGDAVGWKPLCDEHKKGRKR